MGGEEEEEEEEAAAALPPMSPRPSEEADAAVDVMLRVGVDGKGRTKRVNGRAWWRRRRILEASGGCCKKGRVQSRDKAVVVVQEDGVRWKTCGRRGRMCCLWFCFVGVWVWVGR